MIRYMPSHIVHAELEDPISNMEPSSGHEESQKPDASRPPHPSRKPATGRPTEERRHSSNPAKRSKGPNPPLPNDPGML